MAISKIFLQELLEKGLPGATINIHELVNDGEHYQVTIISKDFEGKSRVMQHRMVNDVLKDVLKDKLHALSIITKTEE
jgi:stress-induced morphogen